eukprot:CAMPEP_0198209868 /NCGR_PEP_ID=MMETSP1445-20131203/17784_1 /TAXON_ID=36898 /ORGANISM="Pyramimonas sp., Strain CCMP2087" /LENGTH=193 /DNA_ID=CAMNT_0043883775 /DNA_START=451 /DNA_END=1031 /DNA_ORIENTATION=-
MRPEAKAAKSLRTFFTMVAVRIVLDQMCGSRHRQPIYVDLVDFLQKNPIKDGNEWLSALMEHEQPRMRMLALRVIEVRKIYAEEEFDWKLAQEKTMIAIQDDSLSYQRKVLEMTFDDGKPGVDNNSSFDEDAKPVSQARNVVPNVKANHVADKPDEQPVAEKPEAKSGDLASKNKGKDQKGKDQKAKHDKGKV